MSRLSRIFLLAAIPAILPVVAYGVEPEGYISFETFKDLLSKDSTSIRTFRMPFKKITDDKPGDSFILLSRLLENKQELAKEVLRSRRISNEDAQLTIDLYAGSLIRQMGGSHKRIYSLLIIGLLSSTESPLLKHNCCYALGELGEMAAANSIATLLRDPDDGVRANAVWALEKLQRGDLIEKHLELLRDKTLRVAWHAVSALADRYKMQKPIPGDFEEFNKMSIEMGAEKSDAYLKNTFYPFVEKVEAKAKENGMGTPP